MMRAAYDNSPREMSQEMGEEGATVILAKGTSSPARPSAALISVSAATASCVALALAAYHPGKVNAASSTASPLAGRSTSTLSAATTTATSQAWMLSVTPGENRTYRIHVAEPGGHERQVIDGPDSIPPYSLRDLVRLEDVTGDGRPDIVARGQSAGASALTSEHIYVYDADAGQFLDAEPFENEGEVTRTGPGCIAVQRRNADNMSYSKDRYCWKDKWILKSK